MEIFWFMLLAHLIGDFPLQPLWLLNMKYRSWKGILLHVSVHFVVTSLILMLFLGSLNGLLIAFMLALFHYVIDYTKAVNERTTKNYLLTYWLDQICHVLSILIVTNISLMLGLTFSMPIFGNTPLFGIFYEIKVINYLSLFLFTVYTLEFSRYQLSRKPGTQKQPPMKFNRKQIIKRLFIVTLVYVGLIFAIR